MKTCSERRVVLPKTTIPSPRCVPVIAGLLLGLTAMAMPRSPMPPWPEGGVLHKESFDQPYQLPASQGFDPAVWAESWSGYSLNRSSQQPLVAPWVVPMLATNGNWNVAPQRGALRMWFQPDAGLGTGTPTTLLTLVSTASATAGAVWWSLVVSGDGKSVLLTGEGVNGPTICLSAPAAFQSGTWCLVTLAYTETNCVLFINDEEIATGCGLPTVPAQAAGFTGLVIGSGLRGDLVACGQIEEFVAFTSQARHRQERVFDPRSAVADYFATYSPLAALGRVTDAELGARAAVRMAAQRKSAGISTLSSTREYSPMDTGGGCVTGGPVYMTNVVCSLDTNTGWTVTFSLAGGTNGIAYDIFRTPSLGTGSATNWPWVFIGQGYTCDTGTFTNQPDQSAYYMLGDSTVDPDGDGLGTAFELLISHSDPTLWSTRGDGISDKTVWLQGRNPRVPGSSPESGGAIHLQVYTPLN